MSFHLPRRAALAAPLALVALPRGTKAQPARALRLGFRTEPTSLDPHYHNATPSSQVAQHIFDLLVVQPTAGGLEPGLATAWRPVGDSAWEITLRQGVTFGDGTPFTADDVVFSFERAKTVPTPMGGYTAYLGPIQRIVPTGPHQLTIETRGPTPLLPNYLTRIFILSRKIHGEAKTEDFNSGRAMIGTGPYRLAGAQGMTALELAARDDYWGGRPAWPRVTTRVIGNDAARLAALLAGDIDVIETVPTQDAARLSADARVTVSSINSTRIMYFWFDWLNQGAMPNYAAQDGSPLEKNPFLDARVRRAFDKAIDRTAIAERLMDGFATPAAQFVREGQLGFDPAIVAEPYDPAGARALLAEAGFPNGFRLTVHGPNNRWNNDGKLVATAAQMLSRIGITTRAEALPFAIYVPRETRAEFSFHLSGAGSWTGEAGSAFTDVLMTQDRERGTGAVNRGRYSNPAFDNIVEESSRTLDREARGALLLKAAGIMKQEVPFVMLHQEMNIWAARKGLRYIARHDERTLAMHTVAVP